MPGNGDEQTTENIEERADLEAFLWVLRRALLMICRFIEKRYNLS